MYKTMVGMDSDMNAAEKCRSKLRVPKCWGLEEYGSLLVVSVIGMKWSRSKRCNTAERKTCQKRTKAAKTVGIKRCTKDVRNASIR